MFAGHYNECRELGMDGKKKRSQDQRTKGVRAPEKIDCFLSLTPRQKRKQKTQRSLLLAQMAVSHVPLTAYNSYGSHEGGIETR